MIKDNAQHVILENSFGTRTVYACTVENANQILQNHLTNLTEEIRRVANALRQHASSAPVIINISTMEKALVKICNLEVGQTSKSLAWLNQNKEITITQAHKEELALWMFKNKLSENDLSLLSKKEYESYKLHDSLTIFSGLKQQSANGIWYEYKDTIAAADELIVLESNQWKETAKEHSVVRRFLEFVNMHLAHRDVEYTVVSFNPVVT